jgi:uncharacterized phosphatase
MSLELMSSNGYVGPLASNSGWVDVLDSLDSATGALKYLLDNGYTEQPSVVSRQIAQLLAKQTGLDKSVVSTLSSLKSMLDRVHGVAIVWDGASKASPKMPTERLADTTDSSTEPDQTLYVARHGETDDDDPENGCASSWREIPLNETGRQQAEDLARSLDGLGIAEIHASDLERTMETAKIIAERLGVKVIPEFGLRSWGLGELTGKPDAEVKEKIQAGLDDPDDPPVPGAESYAHFIERYGKTVKALADRQKDLGKPILIVTSSWNVGALPLVLAGEDPVSIAKVKPGQGFELTRSGDEDWQVEQLADHPRIVASGPPVAIPGPLPGLPGVGTLQQVMNRPERKAGPAPEVSVEHPATITIRMSSAGSAAASVQVNLPLIIARKVKKLAAAIPDKDLAEEGREGTPHVTVRFGLHDDDPAAVVSLLKRESPISMTFGKTGFFPDSETHSGDVVYISVDSPDLQRLNEKLGTLPHTDTHGPAFVPHVTVAYVKPGLGEKYAGNDALAGTTSVIDSMNFTPAKGADTVIQLTGKATPTKQRIIPKHLDLAEAKGTVASAARGLLNTLTGPAKAKLIRSVSQQAIRQLKAGVRSSELHFTMPPDLASTIQPHVAQIFQKAHDQAAAEIERAVKEKRSQKGKANRATHA